jgi:hypothetical protein
VKLLGASPEHFDLLTEANQVFTSVRVEFWWGRLVLRLTLSIQPQH